MDSENERQRAESMRAESMRAEGTEDENERSENERSENELSKIVDELREEPQSPQDLGEININEIPMEHSQITEIFSTVIQPQDNGDIASDLLNIFTGFMNEFFPDRAENLQQLQTYFQENMTEEFNTQFQNTIQSIRDFNHVAMEHVVGNENINSELQIISSLALLKELYNRSFVVESSSTPENLG